MPANFVKGDVLEEAELETGKRALAFGSTSGLAAAVKKRWPDLGLEETKGATSTEPEPGEVIEGRRGELYVFALGIQRANGKPKVSWIERSLRTVLVRAEKENVRRILLPRLGGDWTRVKKLLGEIGATTTIDLVVFEQFVRKSSTSHPDDQKSEGVEKMYATNDPNAPK
jgi:hypothetical protein